MVVAGGKGGTFPPRLTGNGPEALAGKPGLPRERAVVATRARGAAVELSSKVTPEARSSPSSSSWRFASAEADGEKIVRPDVDLGGCRSSPL